LVSIAIVELLIILLLMAAIHHVVLLLLTILHVHASHVVLLVASWRGWHLSTILLEVIVVGALLPSVIVELLGVLVWSEAWGAHLLLLSTAWWIEGTGTNIEVGLSIAGWIEWLPLGSGFPRAC